MKTNSRKFLLLLYTDDINNKQWLEYFHLQNLFPDISHDGHRSLVSSLKRKGLIVTERFDNQTKIAISSYGRRQLMNMIPAFLPKWRRWQGEMSLLVFLDSPKHDSQFRYLRKLLQTVGSIKLSRGVYIHPDSFPERIVNECQQSYLLSVVILKISEFSLGDVRKKIIQDARALEISKSYRELSTRADSLLREEVSFLLRTDQTKFRICSLFDRYFEVVSADIGVSRYYFPQVIAPYQLLKKLHNLFE